MVFFTDKISAYTQEEYSLLKTFLSEERLQKCEGYTFLCDKVASALTFVMLRFLLGKQPSYTYLPSGKPVFCEENGLHFSYSHDKNGCICALSTNAVGADIQSKYPFDDLMIKRVLSFPEQQKYSGDEILTRIWTMKESLGKFTGKGVLPYLSSTDFDFSPEVLDYRYKNVLLQSGEKDGLFYTICTENIEEIKYISKEEIFQRIRK